MSIISIYIFTGISFWVDGVADFKWPKIYDFIKIECIFLSSLIFLKKRNYFYKCKACFIILLLKKYFVYENIDLLYET